eukprot:747591-Hanusia_phi.AAC.14
MAAWFAMALLSSKVFSLQPSMNSNNPRNVKSVPMDMLAQRSGEGENSRKRTTSLEPVRVEKKRIKSDTGLPPKVETSDEELSICWNVQNTVSPSPSASEETSLTASTESALRRTFFKEGDSSSGVSKTRQKLRTSNEEGTEDNVIPKKLSGHGRAKIGTMKRENSTEEAVLCSSSGERSEERKSSDEPESASSSGTGGSKNSGDLRVDVKKKLVAPSVFKDDYIDTRPYVCKQFAMTGTCSRGLSCIFAHDRSRYYEKEADKDRAKEQARKRARIDEQLDDECSICYKEFVDPVKTRCGHQFCLNCISSNVDRCPVCSSIIYGDFTPVEEGGYEENLDGRAVQEEKLMQFEEDIIDDLVDF